MSLKTLCPPESSLSINSPSRSDWLACPGIEPRNCLICNKRWATTSWQELWKFLACWRAYKTCTYAKWNQTSTQPEVPQHGDQDPFWSDAPPFEVRGTVTCIYIEQHKIVCLNKVCEVDYIALCSCLRCLWPFNTGVNSFKILHCRTLIKSVECDGSCHWRACWGDGLVKIVTTL